jgi:uncharacterized protein (DUF433 family)
MTSPTARVVHPHIASDATVCGGSPVILGTRFPVRSVVHYILKLGLTPEELVERFPHLTPAHVYDALAHYYDNRAEVESDIAANREDIVRPTAPTRP